MKQQSEVHPASFLGFAFAAGAGNAEVAEVAGAGDAEVAEVGNQPYTDVGAVVGTVVGSVVGNPYTAVKVGNLYTAVKRNGRKGVAGDLGTGVEQG